MSTTRLTTFAVALVLLSAVAPAATATAAIDADAVGDLTATTAPAALDAAAAADATTTATAGDDTVAASDVVVFRLNASGAVDANGDDTLLGDELGFSLVQTDDSTDKSAEPKSLDTAASEGATAVTTTENAVFVAVDLANATFERAGEETTAAAGESYTATTTLATAGGETTRNATVDVVEPTVGFAGDATTATAGQISEFEVTTTLAPGTSLLFELTKADASTGTTAQATVGADGTATVPLSFFTFDAGQAYTITVSAEGTAALNQTWNGETVAPQTATATETAATDTTTVTDGGNAADSTETSTDAPGFGAGVAVLALVAAALLAGRRD